VPFAVVRTMYGYSSRFVSFKVTSVVPNAPESMIGLQPPSATFIHPTVLDYPMRKAEPAREEKRNGKSKVSIKHSEQ